VKTVILMFIVTSPLDKGIEVTKTFLDAVKASPPPYLRSRGVYTTYGDEGYKWYNIVEIDDAHVSEGLTELHRRTVPFDCIEGLRIQMQVLTPMREAVDVVCPERLTTGFRRLDDLLLGGIPKEYAVLLTSPPCDERELLIRRFLDAGANNGDTTFYIAVDPSDTKTLIEKIPDFYIFVCNPQADKIVEDTPNTFKLQGIESLTEINIALTKAFRRVSKNGKPKRAVIEIISDILLHHHAGPTRKWLTSLIPELRVHGFTTLAAIDPGMHSQQEVRAILDLFDGEININEKKAKKGFKRFLIIKKLRAQQYLEEEVPLKRRELQE
jgi:KaiC/GvpD/RAD55 family RecA-like ATPase